MRLVAAAIALLAPLTASGQWWITDYGFDQTSLSGKGAVVAVIDTGIDDSHPDLQGTVLSGRDFSGAGAPDGTAPVGPAGYHGTMVASLIAGQGSAGGVRGVAPEAKLLALSIGVGVQGADTDLQIAQAIRWAVDEGADVINISLSRNSRSWPKSWDEAFSYAFENDVVIVASSGNRVGESANPTAPATIPGVVAVGGLAKDKSGAQLASTTGIALAVTAPAEDLMGSFPGGEVRKWSGSSAAAPLVSGLLALMIEADPKATANDLIQRLIATTTDLGEPGFDAIYGFGAINPKSAVESKLTASQNPLGSLEQWIKLYRAGSSEPEASIKTPDLPEQVAFSEQEVTAVATKSDLSASNAVSWWSNPLLYWVLAPLALLLWFALRSRQGKKQS